MKTPKRRKPKRILAAFPMSKEDGDGRTVDLPSKLVARAIDLQKLCGRHALATLQIADELSDPRAKLWSSIGLQLRANRDRKRERHWGEPRRREHRGGHAKRPREHVNLLNSGVGDLCALETSDRAPRDPDALRELKLAEAM